MLYTRKGDHGETDLADGNRVSKTHPRIECVGTADELCSYIGLTLSTINESNFVDRLRHETAILAEAQRRLFAIGAWAAAVATPKGMPDTNDIQALERTIDRMHTETGAGFSGFVLPGGHPAAAHCHVARTMVRRLERTLLSAGAANWPQTDEALIYVNRLSDFLYAVAKKINAVSGYAETKY